MSAQTSAVTTARRPGIAARVGIALGAAIVVCFATGLLSHWIQHPPNWFWWPANPVWLYRLTQGLHVISGVAAIPLLLVKLWAVYPRLFQRPLIGSPMRALERGSIAVLVGATIFQLSTGLLNIAQYYPWKFFFPAAHYAMAYVALGALAVHLAVKLPVIQQALSRTLDSDPEAAASDAHERQRVRRAQPGERPGGNLGRGPVSRRAVLVAAGVSAAAATLAVAGGARYPARRTPACQLRAPGPQPPNLNWFSMVPRTSSSELYHLLTKTYGQTPAQNWSYPRHSPAPH